jgi:hypothetical protein
MVAAAWATNLTDIYVGGAGTFTALGTGGAGLNTETDYFIQGTDCKSKNAWTNAIKGLIHDNGSSFTVPTTGAIIAWLYYAAVNALEDRAGVSPNFNGGLMFVEGSSDTAYNRYNVAGADTLVFDSWVPYVVDPNTATPDDTVGSPSGTEQWVGVEANLPTAAGPTKGAPIAIDAVRYGRCDIEYTGGDSTGLNDFTTAEAYANDVTRRWGVMEFESGVCFVQGFHSLGVSGTAVNFLDSNKIIFIRDTSYVAAGFNRFEVINASSTVDWDNIIFQALGTQSPGTFVVTSGTLTATDCQFVNVGAFTLLSSSSLTDCIFRNTGIITAPGSDLTGSSILGYEGTADTSPLIWDVNSDPDGELDGMTFNQGVTATHAIEFGTNSPTTMTLRNIDFGTGYTNTQDQNNSTFHFKRGSPDIVTLNLIGCTGTNRIGFRTDGADVTIVDDPVTASVTVNDNNGSPLLGARVILRAANGSGPLPYQESVTITRSGNIASVSHTAHGLSNGQKVQIDGANEYQYNGAKTISNVTVNAYDYNIDSPLPASPATGSITATAIVLEGTTDSSGLISDSRVYATDQDVTGRVSNGTQSPYFKDFPLNDTVDSANGLSISVQLILDE